MKKLIPALALLTLCIAVWLPPSSASAVPKLDIKVAVGVGSTTIVPRFPSYSIYEGDDPNNPGPLIGTVGGRNRESFFNWGMQLAARVTFDNKVFTELAAGFSRFYFTYGRATCRRSRWRAGENPDLVDAARRPEGAG